MNNIRAGAGFWAGSPAICLITQKYLLFMLHGDGNVIPPRKQGPFLRPNEIAAFQLTVGHCVLISPLMGAVEWPIPHCRDSHNRGTWIYTIWMYRTRTRTRGEERRGNHQSAFVYINNTLLILLFFPRISLHLAVKGGGLHVCKTCYLWSPAEHGQL